MTLKKIASVLDKIDSDTSVNAGLALLAAASSSPWFALLPVLGNSLASKRHQKRVEKELKSINKTLQKHEEKIKSITDQQYKLINESILAFFQAPDAGKIKYLKRAIQNSLNIEDLQSQEAVVLSRIVRDISAEEADFLVKNFKYDRIQIADNNPDHEKKVLIILPDSKESFIVTGLVSLGLLESSEPTWGDGDLLKFSAIVIKLLVLLNKPT